MSYAAKFASAFYGPFRDAAESTPGNLATAAAIKWIPAADPGQALREVELDLAEGADIVMVKPALAYLDILARGPRPVSRCAAGGLQRLGRVQHGQSGRRPRLARRAGRCLESLLAIHRAGANMILTYWAKDVAGWLDYDGRGSTIHCRSGFCDARISRLSPARRQSLTI